MLVCTIWGFDKMSESAALDADSTHRMIGLFGGTFDPVHNGHLRMALELRQQLPFDEMRLLPCHRPPHRETPHCRSSDRAAMVKLAIQSSTLLAIDERELKAERPSYTVDTLYQMRQELGPKVSLCWCVGMDSLVNLATWSRWQSLLDVGHLVVVARPGWQPPDTGELAQWLRFHQVTDSQYLRAKPHGHVLVVQQSLLEISASYIRAQIAKGFSAEFLLPQAVWDYIHARGLYRPSANEHCNEEA